MYKKHDLCFMERLRECATLDPETGNITFKGMYAVDHLNMNYKGSVIATPRSHVVWFLAHGVWPKKGYHIDHINSDPFDNRPENLQEVTEQENQRKRRGRLVYRNYGSGKYGHGFYVHADKRDGRFYVTRTLSRGHEGGGDLKTRKQGLGGFDTFEEAESKVKEYIELVKIHGDGYMPDYRKSRGSEVSIRLRQSMDLIKDLRSKELTYNEIAEKTGFSSATIYNVCKGRIK